MAMPLLPETSRLNTLIAEYSLRWQPHRSQLNKLIRENIQELIKHRENVNIASITGSSASLVSGVTVLASLSLAPATGGLSLLLGGSVAVFGLGTATVIGTDVVEGLIKWSALKKIKKVFEEDEKNTEVLIRLLREWLIEIDENPINMEIFERSLLSDGCQIIGNVVVSAYSLKQFSKNIKKNGILSLRASGLKLMSQFAIVMNIGSDFYNISARAFEMIKNREPECVLKLRELLEELREQEVMFAEFIAELNRLEQVGD